MGPTAVGKTALGVHLAKKYSGEVINGDSLQVYKGLDIGTAKVTVEEMGGIPHHLIDIVDVASSYTASDFKAAAEQVIDDIQSRGKVPILVGGSGLYIQGLLNDMKFGKTGEDISFRKNLEKTLEETSSLYIWNQLNMVDPEAAKEIHPNNTRRVIRALESIHMSGEKFSSQQEFSLSDSYRVLSIALNCDRTLLYERINHRVEVMVEQGVLDEAKMLFELVNKENNQAHKGIGYKEWFPYFSGDATFDEAKEKVKQNSRRYAKRQLTWFRNRMENVHWFDVMKDNYLESVELLVTDFLERGE
ncbi:tRNA (adenosine(37)-N6)-dimethylallyltransferase MiaA [Jeotgalibaca ciconiae]|uniref:tRNA dimethylallyltransferase n=2 Tax=Jeotgalibaca ciconiae TaxID=2496265 RepID=A0A3S9HEI9_9LACT|nr:tRNA (adenosine(37)-N6)-dimethylallyltransferase MiaA [Jeotgalibaca ciconiae]